MQKIGKTAGVMGWGHLMAQVLWFGINDIENIILWFSIDASKAKYILILNIIKPSIFV